MISFRKRTLFWLSAFLLLIVAVVTTCRIVTTRYANRPMFHNVFRTPDFGGFLPAWEMDYTYRDELNRWMWIDERDNMVLVVHGVEPASYHTGTDETRVKYGSEPCENYVDVKRQKDVLVFVSDTGRVFRFDLPTGFATALRDNGAFCQTDIMAEVRDLLDEDFKKPFQVFLESVGTEAPE